MANMWHVHKLNALHAASFLILRSISSSHFLEEETETYRAGKWQRGNQCLSGIKPCLSGMLWTLQLHCDFRVPRITGTQAFLYPLAALGAGSASEQGPLNSTQGHHKKLELDLPLQQAKSVQGDSTTCYLGAWDSLTWGPSLPFSS